MKEKKKYTYDNLLEVADNILFTLKVENSPLFKEQNNEFKLLGVNTSKWNSQGLWLYGGRVSRDLKTFLKSPEQLKRMRKTWMRVLIPYYSIFLPGITGISMWQIILDERNKTKDNWITLQQKKRMSYPRKYRHRRMYFGGWK